MKESIDKYLNQIHKCDCIDVYKKLQDKTE
jgi:hypothetical protein